MHRNRKRYSPKFKAKVVLQALSGEKQPEDLCRELDLSPELLQEWKDQFIENARWVFIMAKDVIRTYCLKRGYADHVVLLGLEGQAMRWKKHVQDLITGSKVYRSGHFSYDEYLNDMDGRRILEECLELATEEQRQQFLPLVQAADEQFMTITEPTDRCIWGKQTAEERNYTPEKHWWYYRLPKGTDAHWLRNYRTF